MIAEALSPVEQRQVTFFSHDISADRRETNPEFVRTQLDTGLKERFNTLLSVVEYGMHNGHLVKKGDQKPFIQSIIKGRDNIQSIDFNPVDVDRENAEIIGFEKIDSFLSNHSTPIGSKILSISPKGEQGSRYQHNFYDIFVLKESNGQRYVELFRYSSGLSRADYARRLGMDPSDPPRDSDFLSNPIECDIFLTPDEIHESLHVEHEYMDNEEYNRIWRSSLVQTCVRRYMDNINPYSFNAVLNAADRVWENKDIIDIERPYRDYETQSIPYSTIRQLEQAPVRQVSAPCPGKSGADSNSPFSVSEFSNLTSDRGYDFDETGVCVKCESGPKALGPCGICEECVVEIEKEDQLKEMFTWPTLEPQVQKFSLN
jgi:hypothetical protein